jgi:hypothetical protein
MAARPRLVGDKTMVRCRAASGDGIAYVKACVRWGDGEGGEARREGGRKPPNPHKRHRPISVLSSNVYLKTVSVFGRKETQSLSKKGAPGVILHALTGNG